MNEFEGGYRFDPEEVVLASLDNPDIYGLYRDREGRWMFDLRLTLEAIARRGLTNRTADMNLIGPDRFSVPDTVIDKLGLER